MDIGAIRSNLKRRGVSGGEHAVARMLPSGGDPAAPAPLGLYEQDDFDQWKAPQPILADGERLTQATGRPALIQGTRGRMGNFELVVPEGTRLVHYTRLNDDSRFVWTRVGELPPLRQSVRFRAVALAETSLLDSGVAAGVDHPVHLMAVAWVEEGNGKLRMQGYRFNGAGWFVDRTPDLDLDDDEKVAIRN